MSNIQFGTGVLFGTPVAGNLPTNPTPIQVGALQEASVQFKGDNQKLWGSFQTPIVIARGKLEISGKAKLAALDPFALNQLYFSQASAVGMNRTVINEVHTPGTSVAVANETNFVRDLGVINGSTGAQMTFIASGTPAVGQYTQTGGTYVFAAGETAASVSISYMWHDTTSGATINITNQLQGYAPEVRILLANSFRVRGLAVDLYCCTLGSLSIPTKQNGFWISDIDWECSADVNGNVASLYADTY